MHSKDEKLHNVCVLYLSTEHSRITAPPSPFVSILIGLVAAWAVETSSLETSGKTASFREIKPLSSSGALFYHRQ